MEEPEEEEEEVEAEEEEPAEEDEVCVRLLSGTCKCAAQHHGHGRLNGDLCPHISPSPLPPLTLRPILYLYRAACPMCHPLK